MPQFANRTCGYVGHDWQGDVLSGWFLCVRENCGAVGHCPQCLGYHRTDVVVAFCQAHDRYAPYLDNYPVITPASLVAPAPDTSSPDDARQAGLWEREGIC